MTRSDDKMQFYW